MITSTDSMGKVRARTARDTVRNSSGLIQINFLRMTSDSIRTLIKADEDEVKAMRQELALIMDASLCISKRGEGFLFWSYDRTTRKNTSISNDSDQIYALARRAHLENRIKAIEENSRRLSMILENTDGVRHELMLRKKLDKYSVAGLNLSRILFTKEQNEWIDQPYTPNPYHPENLIHPTDGGLMMRSKSETIIGNKLEQIGLPYRYDDFVNIINERTGMSPFKDNYFADFKVPNLCRGITLHEHFGAFQFEKYPDNALKRLNDYRNFKVRELPSRFVRPEEFTWSLEADLRDQAMLQRIIDRMILPSGL